MSRLRVYNHDIRSSDRVSNRIRKTSSPTQLARPAKAGSLRLTPENAYAVKICDCCYLVGAGAVRMASTALKIGGRGRKRCPLPSALAVLVCALYLLAAGPGAALAQNRRLDLPAPTGVAAVMLPVLAPITAPG